MTEAVRGGVDVLWKVVKVFLFIVVVLGACVWLINKEADRQHQDTHTEPSQQTTTYTPLADSHTAPLISLLHSIKAKILQFFEKNATVLPIHKRDTEQMTLNVTLTNVTTNATVNPTNSSQLQWNATDVTVTNQTPPPPKLEARVLGGHVLLDDVEAVTGEAWNESSVFTSSTVDSPLTPSSEPITTTVTPMTHTTHPQPPGTSTHEPTVVVRASVNKQKERVGEGYSVKDVIRSNLISAMVAIALTCLGFLVATHLRKKWGVKRQRRQQQQQHYLPQTVAATSGVGEQTADGIASWLADLFDKRYQRHIDIISDADSDLSLHANTGGKSPSDLSLPANTRSKLYDNPEISQ